MQEGKIDGRLNFNKPLQYVEYRLRSVHWEKLPKDQKRITYSPHLIVRRGSKHVLRVGMRLLAAPFGRQPLPARTKPAVCEKKFPNAGHGPPKYPLGGMNRDRPVQLRRGYPRRIFQ